MGQDLQSGDQLAGEERPDVPSRLIGRLRITYGVFLVGAGPIAVAAVLALVALLLLDRADEARAGALRIATIYRHAVSAMSARDAYVEANAFERPRYLASFEAYVSAAGADLGRLRAEPAGEAQAVRMTAAIATLGLYRQQMAELAAARAEGDVLLAQMNARLRTLIALADEARRRQRGANSDVVATLNARDVTLRTIRDVAERAQALRTTLVDASRQEASWPGLATPEDPFEKARLGNAVEELREALAAASRTDEIGELQALFSGSASAGTRDAAIEWIDRLLKVTVTEQRSLYDEVAELLTYTVEAHETEQATQEIAVSTLKLGERALSAVARRDGAEVQDVIAESRRLREDIADFPISPLIQTEMLDALDAWRDGLETTTEGISRQSSILGAMNDTAGTMITQVSALNRVFSENADRIGTAVRQILIAGAAFGILLGSVIGIVVARSITAPLKRLARGMIDRAANPGAGPLPDAGRRDELGKMAQATNYFLSELGKRENALRAAVERTDAALRELKETQSELIQAEKLASLGQLVAGVAHEINTPLGIALTTVTLLKEEVRRFEADARAGQVTRAAFDSFVARMGEGAQLVFANLERSVDLVHSFKQVAADQASGERRDFQVKSFTDALFTSLGPMVKRSGHEVELFCQADLAMDSYPGALAQVLTNLLSNAFTHAFPGRRGKVTVRIEAAGSRRLRISFADDGIGISPEHQKRVFDPFFTTGRSTGSTGLGLHIVYNLVTGVLGGTISLWSEPDDGTRFTIDLPRQAPAAVRNAA